MLPCHKRLHTTTTALTIALCIPSLQAAAAKTFGTAGKELQVLKGGAEAELFRYTGNGFLNHMWFGGDFHNFGLTRIRLYVDDEQGASIDMEIIMGHGIGFQDTSASKSTNFCFLESCVRAYIGGATKPMLLSSGLEDYFLRTYYFNRGQYYTRVPGLTHLVRNAGSSTYHFHEADPVLFNEGLRLTLRDGEGFNGKVFGPKPGPQDTGFTTYVWVYEG